MVDFCIKWLNETADRIPVIDLDRILDKLSPASYTAGYIYAAAARLSKTHLDLELTEFLGRLTDCIFTFTNIQIQWVQDICNNFLIVLLLFLFIRLLFFS